MAVSESSKVPFEKVRFSKGNQEMLLQDAKLMEKVARPIAESEEVDKEHWRGETRRRTVYEPTKWICENHPYG